MRKIALLAMAMSVLVVPSVEAKSIGGATACGIDGCRSVDSRTDVEGMHGWGLERRKAPRPGPFYRVRFDLRGGEGEHVPGFTLVYLPRAKAVMQQAPLGSTPWFHTGRAERGLSRATALLKPYPASMLQRFAQRERGRVAEEKRRFWRARGRAHAKPRKEASASGAPVPLVAAGGAVLLAVGGFGVARRIRRPRAGA